MQASYERIPLSVYAVFDTDGRIIPKALIHNDMRFEISRIKDLRRHTPGVVRAVAPVEYTVIVEGREKKIYYEADTNTWFSVKEHYG